MTPISRLLTSVPAPRDFVVTLLNFGLLTSVLRLPSSVPAPRDFVATLLNFGLRSSVFGLLALSTSCEEVIHINLNTSAPALVAEGIISRDSVCSVRLTKTFSYFSAEDPDITEDARIFLSDGMQEEELVYKGNGYYKGEIIKGTQGRSYELEIRRGNITHFGKSAMVKSSEIVAVRYFKNNNQTIYNPYGKTMYVIDCEFTDDPETENYYMVKYILDGKVLAGSYYLMTEKFAVNGDLDISDLNSADADTVRFSEWMFYEGGNAEVQVYSIDRTVYDYFMQLNDILFWKRRINPPAQYNPVSNFSNGALGYFAAWSFDSRTIKLD